MKQIIGYLFRPETIPDTPSPSEASPSVIEAAPEEKEEKPEDALDIYFRLFDKIKLNERYMSVIRTICDLHMRGEHEQFLRERDAFFQT